MYITNFALKIFIIPFIIPPRYINTKIDYSNT